MVEYKHPLAIVGMLNQNSPTYLFVFNKKSLITYFQSTKFKAKQKFSNLIDYIHMIERYDHYLIAWQKTYSITITKLSYIRLEGDNA